VSETPANATLDTLLTRRSVRSFKPEQISDAELDAVLEAGMYAPSGANQQAALIVAVQDEATKAAISRMNATVMGSTSDPYYGAPTVILVLADTTKVTPVEDGALALGNMLNAAHSLGLGAVWIHRVRQMFETDEGKALLAEWGADGDYVGVGSCALGYPAGDAPQPAERKDGRMVKVR
jgi:nitroreductase